MKKIIDKGLYAEGLRQTATLTAVFSAVLVFFLAVTLTSSNNLRSTTVTVEAQTIAGWFAAAVVTAVPAMTLKLFSFLSSRSKSDFYHSVPHKRSTVYFSYLLALTTQFALMLASASAAVIVIFRVFRGRLYLTAPVPGILARWAGEAAGVRGTFGGAYCSVAPVILIMALGFFAAALLCCGAALIARSASGTAFNSVVLYSAILFVPRLLFSMFGSAVSYTVPISPYVDLIENVRFNIPVGSIVNIVRTPFAVPSLEFYPILYTAVVAVLYIAAGALIFCRKKSESAADPAPSKALRFIYSVLVFCSVSFFVTVFLTESLLLRSYNRGGDLTPSMYFTFYGLALIAFLIYVLVTTKKWSGILRALPALGVGILLNGLLALSLYCIVTTEVNFSPEPEQVQWISYCSPSRKDDYGSYFSMSLNDYTLLDGEKYRITDEEVIKAVCGGLSEYVKRYKAGESTAAFGKKQKILVIKTKTGKKTRIVNLSDKEIEKVKAALLENEDFRRDLMTLPDADDEAYGKVEISSGAYSMKGDISAGDIIASLKNEMKTVDPKAFYEANIEFPDLYVIKAKSIPYVSYSVRYGRCPVRLNVPVTKDLFPETFSLITSDVVPTDGGVLLENILERRNEIFEHEISAISLRVPSDVVSYVMKLPGGEETEESLVTLKKIVDVTSPSRLSPTAGGNRLEISFSTKDGVVLDLNFKIAVEEYYYLDSMLTDLGFERVAELTAPTGK